MAKYSLCNMRLTGNDKEYYKHQCEKFALNFDDKKILKVYFGKQDIRGGFSITLIDLKHTVPEQKFFTNKWEMLGYVVGFNENLGMFNRFEKYLIKSGNK